LWVFFSQKALYYNRSLHQKPIFSLIFIYHHAQRYAPDFYSCLVCRCKFGSKALRQLFLSPSIKEDVVSCLGVSEVGAGSDVAGEFLRGLKKENIKEKVK